MTDSPEQQETETERKTPRSALLLRAGFIAFLFLPASVAMKYLMYVSSPHTRAVLRGEGRNVEFAGLSFGEGTLLVQGRLTRAEWRFTPRKWGFFDLYIKIQGDGRPDGQGMTFGGLAWGLSPAEVKRLRFLPGASRSAPAPDTPAAP